MSITVSNLTIWIAAGSVALTLIGLILAVISLISTKQLHKRFKRWKSIHATADLETVYEQTLDQVAVLKAELAAVKAELEELREALARKISTARVIRYNAFADTGSDLSFSIALLDDHQNGVVISSIYGRDESRTYAKPVEQGRSRYALTDEELAVIAEAQQGSAVSRKPVHA
jgi:ABC-type multidrug transport system fused ATPase/permease subunit